MQVLAPRRISAVCHVQNQLWCVRGRVLKCSWKRRLWNAWSTLLGPYSSAGLEGKQAGQLQPELCAPLGLFLLNKLTSWRIKHRRLQLPCADHLRIEASQNFSCFYSDTCTNSKFHFLFLSCCLLMLSLVSGHWTADEWYPTASARCGVPDSSSQQVQHGAALPHSHQHSGSNGCRNLVRLCVAQIMRLREFMDYILWEEPSLRRGLSFRGSLVRKDGNMSIKNQGRVLWHCHAQRQMSCFCRATLEGPAHSCPSQVTV